MFDNFLTTHINNGKYAAKIPTGVTYGFAQVEPNHLSAQRTGQVYAQLPAAADIDILQQGQFVKYDYANGEVNFGDVTNAAGETDTGEWMLVFNEVKLYREGQLDCEFAMIKDNYNARVYSPYDWTSVSEKKTRYYGGEFVQGGITGGQASISGKNVVFGDEYIANNAAYSANTTYYTLNDGVYAEISAADKETYSAMTEEAFKAEDLYVLNSKAQKFGLDTVTLEDDYYEPHYNHNPFAIESRYKEKMMKEGTRMVPRVFKTNVGDIFTTNAVELDQEDSLREVLVGTILTINADTGFLSVDGNDTSMEWQVVKNYTMPDGQPGVKVMRIK